MSLFHISFKTALSVFGFTLSSKDKNNASTFEIFLSYLLLIIQNLSIENRIFIHETDYAMTFINFIKLLISFYY